MCVVRNEVLLINAIVIHTIMINIPMLLFLFLSTGPPITNPGKQPSSTYKQRPFTYIRVCNFFLYLFTTPELFTLWLIVLGQFCIQVHFSLYQPTHQCIHTHRHTFTYIPGAGFVPSLNHLFAVINTHWL